MEMRKKNKIKIKFLLIIFTFIINLFKYSIDTIHIKIFKQIYFIILYNIFMDIY